MISRLFFSLIVVPLLLLPGTVVAENWPAWRGPRGDGTSRETGLPTVWNGPNGQNIAWKSPIPGRGHSSPIVWEDRVFVMTCIEQTGQRVLICLDLNTGAVRWRQVVLSASLERIHKLNSYSSSTPTTDGSWVYVSFLEPDFGGDSEVTPGNMVVAAYDREGNRQWLVRPGRFSSRHGYCSNPVLYKDKIIVNGDHDGDSFIVALDRSNGETLWKIPRENRTRSYVTPIIREIDGRTQMVLSGNMCVASYDPDTGKRHWIIDGPTEQFVASMVYNGKLLFMTAGYPEYHILAIRPNGKGNVTDSHVVWRTTRGCSYVPSPICVGDFFLVTSDDGVGSLFDADTGKRLWMKRMASHYSASLVAAGPLVYFLADDGVMKVVQVGAQFKQLAENELGENIYSSPALSDGRILLRAEEHLYCIAQ